MSWALGGLGVLLVLLVAAGASIVICKRYSLGCECGARDLWIICDEWWRKIFWLWAPREEKVGLVKAQHPPAQAVSGFYRQSSTNSSQYILHSDSDLRLDAHGAFTRFEAVDCDLHLPPTQQSIPPQPLRPVAQAQMVARPRPSPLRPMTTVDFLRMRECEPGPLTPPPGPGRLYRGSLFFQMELPCTPPVPPAPNALAMALMFDGQSDSSNSESSLDETREIKYSLQGANLSEHLCVSNDLEVTSDMSTSYGSYDLFQKSTNNYISPYDAQSAEREESYIQRNSNKRNLQDLERITRYIQSLPDVPGNPHFFDPTDDEEEAPPPAPPDPKELLEHQREQKINSPEPSTGEKIFKALRAVTSQSYIDASEFYNSVLSSAQQIQGLSFNSSSVMSFERLGNQSNVNLSFYNQKDVPNQAIDLFNSELNQEARRTDRQVYDSLQDPPASPLLINDLEQQQTYSYLSDPCFTRTSEDIFNSLEHRRKESEVWTNGIQEMLKLEACESARRRSSQELLGAMEEAQMKRRLSQTLDGCQVKESRDELRFGRRGSLGFDAEFPLAGCYASYEDPASLQRAISCESLCSDTSVALNDLEPGADKTSCVGLVCIGLEHHRRLNYIVQSGLIVNVVEARDLVAPDGSPAQHTFARVCLLPDRQNYVQTKLYKDTDCPSYREKFYLPLNGESIGRTLLVEVFSNEMSEEGRDGTGGELSLLGEASLRLDPAPRPPATTWLLLLSSALPVPHLGELMFSLSYLPIAERLTLVLVKARNLRGTTETPADFFVKVYMLQQGKKMHKKRTSIKRGDKSPIYNEAIIFNVPAHVLQNIQLRLTVAEVNGDLSSGTKPHSVGHVIVGATTMGRSLLHWKQMLAALHRPVAMWHPLRK